MYEVEMNEVSREIRTKGTTWETTVGKVESQGWGFEHEGREIIHVRHLKTGEFDLLPIDFFHRRID